MAISHNRLPTYVARLASVPAAVVYLNTTAAATVPHFRLTSLASVLFASSSPPSHRSFHPPSPILGATPAWCLVFPTRQTPLLNHATHTPPSISLFPPKQLHFSTTTRGQIFRSTPQITRPRRPPFMSHGSCVPYLTSPYIFSPPRHPALPYFVTWAMCHFHTTLSISNPPLHLAPPPHQLALSHGPCASHLTTLNVSNPSCHHSPGQSSESLSVSILSDAFERMSFHVLN